MNQIAEHTPSVTEQVQHLMDLSLEDAKLTSDQQMAIVANPGRFRVLLTQLIRGWVGYNAVYQVEMDGEVRFYALVLPPQDMVAEEFLLSLEDMGWILTDRRELGQFTHRHPWLARTHTILSGREVVKLQYWTEVKFHQSRPNARGDKWFIKDRMLHRVWDRYHYLVRMK